MRLRSLNSLMISLLSSALFISPLCWASEGIRLNQTRVILHESQKSVGASLTNNSDAPFLVKATVLPSLDTQGGASTDIPFVLTPPLFRLEARNQHTTLVVKQNTGDLPSDRESVFYLSFLAVPTSTPLGIDETEQVAAKVSIGIQSVIKLFYRPAKLPLQASDAAAKLTFQMEESGIEVRNPTPYHITLSQLTVGEATINVRDEGAMVAPYSSQHYSGTFPTFQSIRWKAINDYGGETPEYQFTSSLPQEVK